MKTFAVVIPILFAVSLIAMEAGIDGKWTTEMHMDSADGRSYINKSTFILKNEGGLLSGAIESNGRTVDISEGKVDGNKFSFKVTIEGNKGIKTIVYEGTVDGDRLKGVLKVRGIGQNWPFEANRAK